ncbi:unnamed protein product [Polarella glacialis]|uniref:Calcineurin-like phosphoesterase domain-containing protein n=1 Tax=Polarella glacialis TaxID=89957 RepID=A0A813K4V3_POLGL|nr:unnamed protein product [Polarella glacialis]CAE8694857.1 unnamed protein product [Polarella glacialis]
MACPNEWRFEMLDHLSALINKLVGSDDIDFWAITGDNFYDQRGDVVPEFFSKLSDKVKSKPLLTVPGNHDFWIMGDRPGTDTDNLGYGWMQYYGQDTVASFHTGDSSPYNFSGDPDKSELASSATLCLAPSLETLPSLVIPGRTTGLK